MAETETDQRGAGIGALDVLPVFLRARDRKMLVCGNSDGVAWKVELLAAAGARLDVLSDDPSDALEKAAARASAALQRRRWRDDDFEGALAVVAEAADDAEAGDLRRAAQAAGVPLNVIDRPDFCDFQFGSIVNRSPLVVAISTAGAAPVFGQAVRARIETILPAGFARWAAAALQWRPRLSALELPFRMRRMFWEKFAARALAEPERDPGDADLAALLETVGASAGAAVPAGRAILVGAGPGDPELMTLRGVRALQSADVVLYDDLTPQAALDMARRELEKIYVGKRGGRASIAQPEITGLLVRLVGAGKLVVRLKGGDPAIFGRANPEIAALEAEGLACEIVPGVTAATAAAAALGVSLTDAEAAPRVQFVTARAADGGLPDLDWRALADPGATTVAYMGRQSLAEFVGRAMEAGLAASTPAAYVDRATLPEQTVIRGRVDEIAEQANRASLSGPGLLLIGAALERKAG